VLAAPAAHLVDRYWFLPPFCGLRVRRGFLSRPQHTEHHEDSEDSADENDETASTSSTSFVLVSRSTEKNGTKPAHQPLTFQRSRSKVTAG
jgi:hypothetical protein